MSNAAPGEDRTYDKPLRTVDSDPRRASATGNIKFDAGPSSRAVPFKVDPEKERLIALRGTDPDRFARLVPPHTKLALGMYEDHKTQQEGGDAA